MKKLDVLIPTRDRPGALAATLEALCFQSCTEFDVTISDQSTEDWSEVAGTVDTACRLLRRQGSQVKQLRNVPVRGMAQQRQFLLDHATARYCLFLDDDVILEPFVIRNLIRVIDEQQCGFVGNALIGLSYINDVRPHEQEIELWDGPVRAETIIPGDRKWRRHLLHNAANILHVQERLAVRVDEPIAYKIAWIGGCVLFDTDKLRQAGGFGFWQDLPRQHCGEDVLAQLRVAKQFGGCGVLPSGAYHQELPTTLRERRVNAPEVLSI